MVCFILHCKDIGCMNYSHMLFLIYNNSFNTNPTQWFMVLGHTDPVAQLALLRSPGFTIKIWLLSGSSKYLLCRFLGFLLSIICSYIKTHFFSIMYSKNEESVTSMKWHYFRHSNIIPFQIDWIQSFVDETWQIQFLSKKCKNKLKYMEIFVGLSLANSKQSIFYSFHQAVWF